MQHIGNLLLDDSIDDFYHDIAAPFIRDFEANRADLKCAYGAVWALDSFASHIFYFDKYKSLLVQKDDIQFKNQALRPNSADFKLITDVSAATKHAIITRKPAKKSVQASSDILSMNLDGFAA